MLNGVPMEFRTSILHELKGVTVRGVDFVDVGNKESYDALVGEAQKYEFLNTVQLGPEHRAQPDPWTQVELTEDWGRSYAEGINKTPAPLYIPGHADTGIGDKMRAQNDGYVTGARVKDNVLYIRNTMVLDGTDDHKALVTQTMKEIKAKMLSTSSGDIMSMKIEINDETDEVVYKAMSSLKGRSNALVEFDLKGSDADIVSTSFKQGSSDESNNMQGANDMEGKTTLTSSEMCLSLKSQIALGSTSLKQIETEMGVTFMTAEDKVALKRLADAEAEMGVTADVFLKGIQADKEAAFITLKEGSIKDKFKTDELIEVATSLFKLDAGSAEEIIAEVERVASMKAVTLITGNIAGSIGASFNADNSADNVVTGTMEG